MKPRLNQKRSSQGSVLLIAMGITFVLGLGLASYLTLANWQHTSIVRSQAWNSALALAEAGVDEALAQLNPAALLFETNVDRGANGWSLGGDGWYHAPRRTLPDGDYDVAISSDTYPIICSTGYVTIPALSATVARAVRVTTGTSGIFRGGMAARVDVDLKGNKIATDSFDSIDPNYSTDGLYDPAKRKANGDIACTDGLINVQNADVRGTLYTGPEGGYSLGPQGTVGDLTWPEAGGMQEGHYKNDFNMDFPAVLPPFQTAIQPAEMTLDGTNYAWGLGEGNYLYDGAKDFKTGDIIRVTGRAIVYVTGNFIMQGGSSIIIDPGASLRLYVGGVKTEITSLNNRGNCATFTYFGLPANASVTLTASDILLGMIYAPSAELTLAGSADPKYPTDFQGACAVNNIKMNGHFNFHFDENLRRAGPIRGYQITSWTEI